METFYTEFYSDALSRVMPIKVYGHAGKPSLFIPCQDGRFYDFENFNMSDTCADFIESGRMMVFSIDTIDAETWSFTSGDPHQRMERHEAWINYITSEAVPFIREYANEKNGWEGYPGIFVFGSSMGATHALNLYLRFPGIFDRCMALSGVYNASFFLGDYMDDLVYRNSITDYMANFPPDHPFIAEYNRHRAVVCVGRGAWEVPWSTEYLAGRFKELGIDIWVDFWGYDVNHDWPWWYRQTRYFLPWILD